MGALLLWLSTAAAEPVVIASPDIPDQTLSTALLRRICLGQSSFLGSGARIELILPPDDSEAMSELLAGWLGVDASGFARHWLRMTMSGSGIPPEQMSAAAALRHVSENHGVIAVIDADTPLGDARILEVTP